MSKFQGRGPIGPRARVAKLDWEDPKPKKRPKKKKVQSKPKKKKITTNKHDPRTKSSSYPNVNLKPVNERVLKELIHAMEITAEIPNIVVYEVEYLDDEEE